jgi:hypothetical protein
VANAQCTVGGVNEPCPGVNFRCTKEDGTFVEAVIIREADPNNPDLCCAEYGCPDGSTLYTGTGGGGDPVGCSDPIACPAYAPCEGGAERPLIKTANAELGICCDEYGPCPYENCNLVDCAVPVCEGGTVVRVKEPDYAAGFCCGHFECENGAPNECLNVACDQPVCEGGHLPKMVREPNYATGDCCGEWSCQVDNGGCADGVQKEEVCNECMCREGQWICTTRHCTPYCEAGDEKKVDCNTCACSDGRWACTEKSCEANEVTCKISIERLFGMFDLTEYGGPAGVDGVCSSEIKQIMASGLTLESTEAELLRAAANFECTSECVGAISEAVSGCHNIALSYPGLEDGIEVGPILKVAQDKCADDQVSGASGVATGLFSVAAALFCQA